jgi:hypothetical protein
MRYLGLMVCGFLMAACTSTAQMYGSQLVTDPSNALLQRGQLESFGIAFVTPSTVTGQEDDKPALALAFAKTLKERRPATRVVPLTETLGSVNRIGLSEDYKRMIVEYRDSGLLDRTALAELGKATGARYVALLNMAAFQQSYHDRFGVFGLRVLQTKDANIRITLQIWNSEDGSVVWEGVQELHMANETAAEDAVSFGSVVQAAAEELIAKIP